MKIQYCSDLHLEFPENRNFLKENPIKPIGEVLILAGDILLFSLLNEEVEFIDYVSNNFEAVFWLPGNHEYYYSDISEFDKYLNKKIRQNFHLVNNHVVQYKNANLIFTTLWGNISPQKEIFVKNGVSDFSVIKNFGKKLLPKDFNLLHKESIGFLESALQISNSANKNIVVTHHVPTFFNYPEQYKNSNINEAFAVEMFDFICNNNIEYWIYGHSHVNTLDFEIGTTKMVTNQLGYVHLKEHENFSNEIVLEI